MEKERVLKAKHKRIAEYHVLNPEESQGACYRTQYKGIKNKTSRERASRLFARQDFKDYCETLRQAGGEIARVNILNKVNQMIKDPQGLEAIELLGNVLTNMYISATDPTASTPDVVIEGQGRGITQARRIERLLNETEKHRARVDFARTINDRAKLEHEEVAPVTVNINSRAGEAPTVDRDAYFASLDGKESADHDDSESSND